MTRPRATAGEAQRRRVEVLRLRLCGYSEPEIARRLNVSPATVSRDLQAIQESWRERCHDSLDVRTEVAEAVDLYAMLERSAVRELVSLEDAGNAPTGAKVRCLWAARAMREARIDLLVGVGLIGSSLPLKNPLPTAAEITEMLRKVRTERCELISEAERACHSKRNAFRKFHDGGS